MSNIKIADLEVFYSVGVTDEERATLQRLLITVDLSVDFSVAAINDRLAKTIDYYAVSQRLLEYGKGRSWKLIEKLAVNLADMIYNEFHPHEVTVEVKKFPIPQAAYVSVTWTRN